MYYRGTHPATVSKLKVAEFIQYIKLKLKEPHKHVVKCMNLSTETRGYGGIAACSSRMLGGGKEENAEKSILF